MIRLALVAAATAALGVTLAPAASADSVECRHPWVETWTGLYHPLTGERINYCTPTWPAP
ncbi:MAG TPA: hypothetical protein VNQ77_14105 [Frankiaceae bacterium]|nr:hypothetical protein [Frankiaceae bacterium]